MNTPDPQPSLKGETSLQEALDSFLLDLKSGHSPATERNYRFILARFCRSLEPLEASTLPVAQLQTDWAVDFVRKLAENASKATLATTAAALLKFYRWCSLERLVVIPADEYERLALRLRALHGKQTRTILNKVPSDEVIETLLELARAKVEGSNGPEKVGKGLAKYDGQRHRLTAWRNLALLETLRSTGARVSEICSLTQGDIDATNRRARVLGKGSKERWVYFSETAWQTLQTYLQTRARLFQHLKEAIPAPNANKEASPKHKRRQSAAELARQPIFARHDRGAGMKEIKPLTPRSIQQMLWELVEEAELVTQITPHKFRHWFATRVLAATGDLAVTQDLLGHANPATTRIYAQVSESKKQDAHRQVFQ